MELSTLVFNNQDTMIISILVLFLGYFITRKIPFLSRNNIPAAVTGGLICSLVVAGAFLIFNFEISFRMELRDLLLLSFFSTIGLSAKMSTLKTGGKALMLLLVISIVFLVIQNLTGIAIALLMDANPVYGLLAGSISFAGGHGTAIAWGEVTREAGLEGAEVVGIACATFGLVAGGLIGGPIAGRLIKKHKLEQSPNTDKTHQPAESQDIWTANVRLENALSTLLMLGICVTIGSRINIWLSGLGLTLPSFLTAMFVGILLTNLADVFKIQLNDAAISRISEISLQLFLSMSLMSMQLWLVAQAFGPLILVLMAQMLTISLFTVFIVFRLMGKDYDASVIAAGFLGLGLGATPVAIANMQALTAKYAPSPKAFLVVPLVGAFFIDISNAAIIKSFLSLPLLQF